ncbi:MAG: peptidoglycan-binding domain-containing protein [Chthoniobacteraceae bacterium]|nr:peptidoglycan-binding domain-containing protein [Chthoniobacteraceae bacterium]
MNKLLLLSALAVTLAAPLAQADDAVRNAQTTLRDTGFYTGPVDGELNDATKAALRRYQIRNQMEPSGELTAETSAALAKEASPAPAPAPEAAPVPPPAPEAVPAPAAPVPPPAPVAPVPPPPADPGYAAVFARSPYENAPVEIQRRTVRDAQALLGQRGFYKGAPDGLPGPGFQKALLRFQAERGLPPSGRLDIDTLAGLHLLPVAKLPRPRRAPVPYEAPVPGAVRGVPVD